MDSITTAALARRMHVRLEADQSPYGMSGSSIHFGMHSNGQRCVLKITSGGSSLEPQYWRREFDFYHRLSDRVPLRTPALLDSFENENLIALLLTAQGKVEPPVDWDEPSWLNVAVQLARLHSTSVPDAGFWHLQDSPTDAWISPNRTILEEFWRDSPAPDLDALLDAREALALESVAGNACLVHGDCHSENLLRDANAVIWIDWQSCGIGSAARDLAFLSARMAPTGTTLPHTFLRTYSDARGVNLRLMEHSVLAAELGILVFEWPLYAVFNSREANDRVRARARMLADRWFATSPSRR